MGVGDIQVGGGDRMAGGAADGTVRHFCASAYVFDRKNGMFLFVRHRKSHLWIPPGGHVEENERPDVAAIREVAEETGIAIRIVDFGLPPAPFPCETPMVQPLALRIYGDGPGHEHMSFVYGAAPIGGKLSSSERAPEDVGWFPVGSVVEESFAAPPDVRAWCRYLSSGPAARFFIGE
ncbi:MAG: NUDIX domain-containing protein [Puniceicoccales bacterium]|nr:NUDIX domain-containing protein [Puniceicoccales bacterium]